ncbi:MAG: TetR/AcrR family transcriptional regulator [Anaerolineae bacterium]|jgi:AcrR family transcriptional regulator
MVNAGNEPGLSRRERLKCEREARILDAAAAVFAEKGYHGATIREIASQADVADGTIYNYFDSKFDLIIGILSRIAELERLPAELTDGLRADPREFFVAAFRDRLDRIERGEEMLQAVLPQVFVNDQLRGRFYRQYAARISTLLEGYLHAEIGLGQIKPVDVALLTRIVQATFVGLLVLRIIGDEPLHAGWSEIPELLGSIFFDGVASDRVG